MKTADPDPPTRGEKSHTDDVRTRSGDQGTEEEKPFSLGVEGNAVVLRGTLPNGALFHKKMELPPEILSYFQTLKSALPIVLDFTPLSPLIRVKAVSPTKDLPEMSPSKEFNIATGMSAEEPIVVLGREHGKNLRAEWNLDEFDRGTDCARVIVPDNVVAVTTPFFAGLFGDSVRLKGPTHFKKKYQFECDEILRPLIEDGIEESMRSYNLGR